MSEISELLDEWDEPLLFRKHSKQKQAVLRTMDPNMSLINKQKNPRFLRFPDLRQEFGIPFTRMHIDRLEKEGSFPKRVSLGMNTVVWIESEISDWVQARIAERDR